MSLRENLKELGWHLTQEGIDTVSENGQIQDVNTISKKALDFDLRDIGDAALPEDFIKEPSKLEKPVIVQIQKIRNVTAPKANEESTSAPRMLKLTLHDGKSVCTALETSPISSLNINTPPGTKVMLKNEDLEVCHGVICLNPSVITVLGGKVSHMIEKWELNRSLAKHTRGGIGADGGPPPWIPFGQRLEELSVDKQFKSLQDQAKQDNAEFEAQREGAIAEAQRLSGVKKVFGGGTKPLLDANVQKIVDAGFTEEQAENALKYTKNNVERALKILQKQDNPDRTKDKPQKEAEQPKRKGRNKESTDEDSLPVKPSGKVSLFDFLEDKLPNVPDKDRNNRQNNYNSNCDVRGDRGGYNRDKSGGRGGARPHGAQGAQGAQGARYDNNRPRNYTDNYHRDDRKYQPSEKPPRFQRKQEERNKQQLQQANNNMYNNYNNQYSNRGGQLERPSDKQQYRGNSSMDGLVQAAGALALADDRHQLQQHQLQHQHQHQLAQGYQHEQYARSPPVQEAPPFRRGDAKFPDAPYGGRQPQPPPQHNGYMEAAQNMYPGLNYGYGRQYAGGGYGRAAGGGAGVGGVGGAPFLAGGLLGFQNAAVNEQARAMLGVADVSWNIGDRCLALYWEDNNFYEAEITGISQNTVVVKFCAYGNHEEILKSNCLPFPNQVGGHGAHGGHGGYAARGGVFAARRP